MAQHEEEEWDRLRSVLREASRRVDEKEDADLSYLLQATLKRIEAKMDAAPASHR